MGDRSASNRPDARHAATAPRPRSPAQIEASRRNGARSRGPVTEEGKARASRNALKHGLTAMHHLVLEDEAPAELEEMTARLMAEVGPMSEIEARLARRLAIAFWKGERAERIEVALFDAAPKLRPPQAGYQWEQADPLDHLRPQALQRRARLPGPAGPRDQPLPQGAAPARARTRSRNARTNPRTTLENEPESPQAPANDDAPAQAETAVLAAQEPSRNEPEPPAAHGEFWEVDGVPLLDVVGTAAPASAGSGPAGRRRCVG